jgi:hypothetical protein
MSSRKRARLPRPKVRIYPNGKATLSGLTVNDLSSLLTAASLHRYDNPPKPAPDPQGDWLDEIRLANWQDGCAWHDRQRWIVDAALESLTGERNQSRRLLSKVERMLRVKEARELRQRLPELLRAAMAQRENGEPKNGN